jgi:hypothetical protein
MYLVSDGLEASSSILQYIIIPTSDRGGVNDELTV